MVIAIIAILAAILFPAFMTAKEHGRMASCLSNLKQLGTGFTLYMDNNNGGYPASQQYTNTPGIPGGVVVVPQDWEGSLYPSQQAYPQKGQIWQYVRSKKVYLCPTDAGIAPTGPGAYPFKDYAISYSMNSYLSLTKQSAVQMRNVSRMMLIIHEGRKWINDAKFSMWSTGDVPDDIHFGGTCLLYADFHAKWLPQKKLIADKAGNYWVPITIKW